MAGKAKSRAPQANDEDEFEAPLIEGLKASGLNEHVGFMLRAASSSLVKDLVAAFRPFNLRASQYACLLVVHAQPGLKQQRVGEILAVKRSNLVATIDQLEARGYLIRSRPAENRRINTLYLTEAGEAVLKRLRQAEAGHRRRLVETLGEADLAHLLATLSRLAQLGLDDSDKDPESSAA